MSGTANISSSRRKREAVSLEIKKQVIDAADDGLRGKELCERFNFLNRTTLFGIVKNKENILSAIEEGGSAKRSRLTKESGLDHAVLTWFRIQRSNNLPVSGPLLQKKAIEISKTLQLPGYENFVASNGWLTRFKERHSISFNKGVQGEAAAAVNLEAVEDWWQQVILNDLAKFSPADIFNADETGLFWRLMPNNALAFKGEKCSQGNKSKDRLTVLVCANMDGSEKLPLFVVGKWAKPRCFKNATLPVVDYDANSKAWMTSTLFENWLKNWDKKLQSEARKVLLYVDNFPAHPRPVLRNIVLKFLPPNTTAISQPMEQGIVQNIKLQYRKLLLRRRVAALDREEEPPFFDFNVLDALKTLKLAWESVTPTTIVNCFSKAGFVKSSSVESVYGEPLKLGCGMEMELKMEEEEEEIQNYCNELQKQSHEYNSIDDDLELEDFINIDQDLHTSGNFRKEDIVASIMGGNNGISEEEEDTSSNSEEDDDDENYAILDEPEVLISRRVAQKALDDLRLFMRQSNCSEADLHLNTLDDLFVKLRISKQRESVQTKITDSISLNDSTKSR